MFLTIYDATPYGVTANEKDADSYTPAVIQKYIEAGIPWTRFQASKKRNARYGWTQTDAHFDLCVKAGLKIAFVLQNPEDADLQPGATQMPTPAAWGAYATWVYDRYYNIYGANWITSFEGLNEEPAFEQNQAFKTPQVYIPVLQSVHDALRTAGHTGLIGGFGFTNYNSAQEIFDWYDAFYGDPSNPGRLIDYACEHVYHGGLMPDDESNGKPSLTSCINAHYTAALAHNHGEKPLWIGEIGLCAQGPDCNRPITLQTQSDFLEQAYDIAIASGGKCDHMFTYTMCADNYGFNILNYADTSPRLAYTMLQNKIASTPAW